MTTVMPATSRFWQSTVGSRFERSPGQRAPKVALLFGACPSTPLAGSPRLAAIAMAWLRVSAPNRLCAFAK